MGFAFGQIKVGGVYVPSELSVGAVARRVLWTVGQKGQIQDGADGFAYMVKHQPRHPGRSKAYDKVGS